MTLYVKPSIPTVSKDWRFAGGGYSSREHSSERLGETKVAPINVSSKRARDGTYMISISVEKETNYAFLPWGRPRAFQPFSI